MVSFIMQILSFIFGFLLASLSCLHAQTGEGYADLGLEAMNQKQYEEAEAYFTLAISFEPSLSQYYYFRGAAKMYRRNFVSAIEDFDQAIQIDPDYTFAYRNRGVSRESIDQYSAAIRDFDKAIALDSEDAGTFRNRGVAKAGLRQYQAAIQDYDQAILLNPTFANAFRERGVCYHHLDQNQSAIRDYNQSIQLDPHSALAYYNRGTSKASLLQYREAIRDYDQALELDPSLLDAYNNRGNAKQKLGQYHEALADYNHVLQKNPEAEVAQANRQVVIEKIATQAPQIRSGPQTHIVSVGIANYANPLLTLLFSPVRQAYQFALFAESSRFVFDYVPTLTNSKATRIEILHTIRKHLCDSDRVGPDDLVMFYFSGHGITLGNQIGLCPYDYYGPEQLISDQEIIDLMQSSPARHKVCIIEACRSEALAMSLGDPFSSTMLASFHQAREQISGGLIYLTSTEVGKPSFELHEKGGIFSYYFLKAIQGKADRDNDDMITSRELYDYLKRKVGQETEDQQVPQINAEGYKLNIPLFMVR